MIRVPADTPLTVENVKKWINEFKTKYLPCLLQNRDFYLNNNCDTLPYAKKIVTISAAATVGDGIELKADDNEFSPKQQRMLEEIKRLFNKQIISYEDLSVITQGATYGVAYELGYMSNDEKPLPKCKWLDACHTFVVFDDTVEDNGLYGVFFNEQTDDKYKHTDVYVYDKEYRYTLQMQGHITESSFYAKRRTDRIKFSTCYALTSNDSVYNVIGSNAEHINELVQVEKHNMGRMPITMYFNNNEEQGDFEQVKPTIIARNKIHELAMEDAETIAGNYLVFVGNELGGSTEEEKVRTVRKIGRTKVIEIGEGEDVKILTKQETFSMISVYGKDVENKIYDLSMVINFSSEEFSGNVTGVALRLKLFPFKRLVKNKDYFIEKMYRRRLKMYMHALGALNGDVEEFDVADIKVLIKRTWEENILELAQVIGTLAPLGLFSDKYLIERMPDGEYEVEVQQKENEGKDNAQTQASQVGLDNSYLGDLSALVRQYGNA